MTDKNDLSLYKELLKSPLIPENFPPDQLYHLASLGAVQALKAAVRENTELSREAAAALEEAAEASPSKNVRRNSLRALAALADGGSQPALDVLFDLALHLENAEAQALLAEKDYVHYWKPANAAKYFLLKKRDEWKKLDPDRSLLTDYFVTQEEEVQKNIIAAAQKTDPAWAVTAACLMHPLPEGAVEALMEAYGRFSSGEKELFIRCAEKAPALPDSVPADLFLKYGDRLSLEASLKHHLVPSDPQQVPLFYFLSEQWLAYYQSDADFYAVRNAFLNGSRELKKRIAQTSRRSGNIRWMQDIDPAEQLNSGRRSLSLSEWGLLVRSLINNQNYEKLWKIFPTLPFCYSIEAFTALEEVDFIPADAEEKTFFEAVRTDLQFFDGTVPLTESPAFVNTHAGASELTVSPDGKFLAVSFLDGMIMVWDLSQKKLPCTQIHLPAASASALQFSHDDRYLAAADTQNKLHICTLPEGTVIKQIPAPDPNVIGLYLSRNDRQLYAVGRNGRGLILGFPHGSLIADFDLQHSGCFRSVMDNETEWISILDTKGNILLFDPEPHQNAGGFAAGEGTQILSHNAGHDMITCINARNEISSWNILSEKPVHSAHLMDGDARPVTAFDLVPGEVTALGRQDGSWGIFRDADGVRLSGPEEKSDPEEEADHSAVTGIQSAEGLSCLYVSRMSGRITEYDLTFFNWFTHSYGLTELPALKTIEAAAKKARNPELKSDAAFMKTVIEWRTRFDIDIDFEVES